MKDDLESKIDKDFGRPHHYEQEFFEAEDMTFLIAQHNPDGRFRVYSKDGKKDWFGGPLFRMDEVLKIRDKTLLVGSKLDIPGHIACYSSDSEYRWFNKSGGEIKKLEKISGEIFAKVRDGEKDTLAYCSVDGKNDWFQGPHYMIEKSFVIDNQTYVIALKDNESDWKIYSKDGKTGWFGFSSPHDDIGYELSTGYFPPKLKFVDVDGKTYLLNRMPDSDKDALFSLDGAVSNLFGGPHKPIYDIFELDGRQYLLSDAEHIISNIDGFSFRGKDDIINSRYGSKGEFDETYNLVSGWLKSKDDLQHIRRDHVECLSDHDVLNNSESLFGVDHIRLLDALVPIFQRIYSEALEIWLMSVIRQSEGGTFKVNLEESVEAACIIEDQDFEDDVDKRYFDAFDKNMELDFHERASILEVANCSKILLGDYIVLRELGAGAIKNAYLSEHKQSGVQFAMLKIDPSSRGFDFFKKKHPSLDDNQVFDLILSEEFSAIRIMGRLVDRTYIAYTMPSISARVDHKWYYFLPTEKYEKTLEQALKGGALPVEKAYKYFYQMCYALNNCHEENIVHRDLKPDNIGISARDNILISDFGGSSKFLSDADNRYGYPLHLRPPELAHDKLYWMVLDKKDKDFFKPEANIWTLGGILYQMLTTEQIVPKHLFRAPFFSEEYDEQNKITYAQINAFDSIRSEKYKKIAEIDSAIHLLDLCLQVDPEKRKGALKKCMNIIESIGYS